MTSCYNDYKLKDDTLDLHTDNIKVRLINGHINSNNNEYTLRLNSNLKLPALPLS